MLDEDNDPLEHIESDMSDLDIGDSYTRMINAVRLDRDFEDESFRQTVLSKPPPIIDESIGEPDFSLRERYTILINDHLGNYSLAEMIANAIVNHLHFGCVFNPTLQKAIELYKDKLEN